MLPTWIDPLGLVCACSDDLLWLIAKSFGHFLMHPLHFRMVDGWQFAITRLVSCDLCRTSSLQALLFEVCLDLFLICILGLSALSVFFVGCSFKRAPLSSSLCSKAIQPAVGFCTGG
jgi:hypothetical protein